MAKLPKVQKWFRKFGKLCPFMSALNEQQLVFVCSHILKLNKAKCVHSLPQKRELRPKPVPGRGCPSLKLRLSTWANKVPQPVLALKTDHCYAQLWSGEQYSWQVCCPWLPMVRKAVFECVSKLLSFFFQSSCWNCYVTQFQAVVTSSCRSYQLP